MPIRPQPKRKYRSERAEKRARYRRLRPITRVLAWEEDGGRCVFPTCRRLVPIQCAHMHEPQGRAVDDPCDIDTVVTVCADCHAEMHVRVGGKRKSIQGSRSGGLHFYQRSKTGWDEVHDES